MIQHLWCGRCSACGCGYSSRSKPPEACPTCGFHKSLIAAARLEVDAELARRAARARDDAVRFPDMAEVSLREAEECDARTEEERDAEAFRRAKQAHVRSLLAERRRVKENA